MLMCAERAMDRPTLKLQRGTGAMTPAPPRCCTFSTFIIDVEANKLCLFFKRMFLCTSSIQLDPSEDLLHAC